MPDKEKVIKGLEHCTDIFKKCEDGCPYYNKIELPECNRLKKDALALLKEQEAVVRCKDCKYWNSNLGEHCEKINGYPGAEWFCANGERKEGR